jgi:hypothetical protein
MVLRLLAAGKRVGISATSHKVIENFLRAVFEAADRCGGDVRAVQKPGEDGSGISDPRLSVQTDNAKVRAALASGAALKKFHDVVALQSGDVTVIEDPSRLPRATQTTTVNAPREGYLQRLDAELVGRSSMLLGAGRDRVEALIDPATGIVVDKKPGARVAKDEPILTLHYNDARRLTGAMRLAESAMHIGDTPPPDVPLVRAWVHHKGETSYV